MTNNNNIDTARISLICIHCIHTDSKSSANTSVVLLCYLNNGIYDSNMFNIFSHESAISATTNS